MISLKQLPPPFHWQAIQNIDSEDVLQLAHYLDMEFDRDFQIKSNWSYYKQFDVFSIDGKPIFHIKKSLEKDFFYEALALHLGQIVDPELCPKKYIVGNYSVGFWKWKSPIPFILTTYVVGPPVKKGILLNYVFELGRQFIFHKFLELHDVCERHFIINNKLLVRIDYDLSFRELEGAYTGFDCWTKEFQLLTQTAFKKGMDFETKKMRENIASNREKFQDILSAVKLISIRERNHRILHEFYGKLIKYWSNNCADVLIAFDLASLEMP